MHLHFIISFHTSIILHTSECHTEFHICITLISIRIFDNSYGKPPTGRGFSNLFSYVNISAITCTTKNVIYRMLFLMDQFYVLKQTIFSMHITNGRFIWPKIVFLKKKVEKKQFFSILLIILVQNKSQPTHLCRLLSRIYNILFQK